MTWNDELIAEVNGELFWDRKVDNTAIAVSDNDGAITLRGTKGVGPRRHGHRLLNRYAAGGGRAARA
jgi:hypothetical protein